MGLVCVWRAATQRYFVFGGLQHNDILCLRAATQQHFVFGGLQHNDILCLEGCNTTTFCVWRVATQPYFVFGGLQHNDILCLEGCNTTIFCVWRATTQRYFVFRGLQHNDILSTLGRLRSGETFSDSSGEGCVIVTQCNVHLEYQLSIRSRTDETHGKP